MTSPVAFASDSEEGVDNETQHADSMAYLAALNTINLILIDAANLQRNNYMVYTSALCLAMQKIADGDEQGQILLQTIQQSITFDQEYLMKSGKGCVEILAEFKKLWQEYPESLGNQIDQVDVPLKSKKCANLAHFFHLDCDIYFENHTEYLQNAYERK